MNLDLFNFGRILDVDGLSNPDLKDRCYGRISIAAVSIHVALVKWQKSVPRSPADQWYYKKYMFIFRVFIKITIFRYLKDKYPTAMIQHINFSNKEQSLIDMHWNIFIRTLFKGHGATHVQFFFSGYSLFESRIFLI